MTEDIVTRLCNYNGKFALTHEAADEIEQLRADRDKWRKIADKLAITGGCWTCEEWMEIGEFSHGDPEKPVLCEWRVALHRYQKEAIHDR